MNTGKTVLATLLAAMAVTPLAVTPVNAQFNVQVQSQATYSYTQAELDQMLAPIALYPDALLSQVLMAATYPIEVVEAARWSRANPGLQGDDAVRAVHYEDWDPSVKSLVAFPQILQRMDENLEWTRTLGDAFLAQEPQMMDQVQQLRQRAQAAGHLRTSEQIRVEHQGPVIIVRQASPEYVYVPYYDPMEVYGTWMWPAYRPVAWSPWPGYSRGYRRPGVSVGFWWGRPVGLSLGFFFGDFDWNRRHTHVAHSHSYYYRAPEYSTRSVTAERGRWLHDPQHRRAVDYRSSEVSQRFASAQTERREAGRQQPQPTATVQAQPQATATVQAQPQAVSPTQRADRRDDRRAERLAAPAAAASQPAAQPRSERRDETRVERREDRRAERQAAPMPTPVQPAAQPRAEQRDDRRAERQAAEATRQAQQQARDAQRLAQQQARQPQPAATMPAAQAPQTPRAERQEKRDERREKRKEQREEKG